MSDQVTIKSEPTGAFAPEPEQQQPAETSDRPEWLPENFKSPEDLVSSYKELQRKLGGGEAAAPKETEEAPDATKTEATEETQEAPAADIDLPEGAQEKLEAARIDVNALRDEYLEHGELTEESMKALEAAGFPEDIVNEYFEGVQLKSQQLQNQIMSSIGGEENFTAMSKWAQENLSKEELTAYNKAVETSPELAGIAVQGLYSRYTKANGSEPSLIDGGGRSSTSQGFRSYAEMTTAMSDPRYHSDPAYRADIEQRALRSSL